MTLVALSASYGAAGSRIGPGLAERLGVPFLDRAIPLAVAERLHVPVDEAVAHEDRVNLLERLLRGFIGGDNVTPTPTPATDSDEFHEATVAALRAQAGTGACGSRWSSRASTRRPPGARCARPIRRTRRTRGASTTRGSTIPGSTT
jgi:hypothetical protein